MTIPLSNAQRAAVESREPKLCILACAGSGKTTTLTRRIAALIEANELEPSKGAVITFTVLAADHLRIELADLLKRPNATSSLFIGTIHAFCLELLRIADPLRGDEYKVLGENQQLILLNRHWDRWAIQAIEPQMRKAELLDRLVASIEIIKMERIDATLLQARHPELARVFGLYQDFLRDRLYFDFTDLLRIVVDRLERDDKFRALVLGRFSHLFVDEYQDVDPLQERLIQILASSASLSVVGDDDQAIYQFRGTDVTNIRNLARSLPPSAVITLDENRRCARNILELSRAIVEKCEGRLPKAILATNPGGFLAAQRFATVADEAAFIVSRITQLRHGRRTFADFAILMRSVSSYGNHYLDALRAAGIPFVCKGDRGLFARPEIGSITGSLEVICKEPLAVAHLLELKALLRKDLKLLENDTREVAALADPDYYALGLSADDVQKIRNVLEIRDRYLAGKFNNTLEIVLAVIDRLALLRPEASVAEFYNVCRFTQIASEFDEIEQTRRLHRLCAYLRAYAHRQYDEAVPLDPEVDAVQVLTVHQAKGLEYDVVFVPMVVERRFPVEAAGRGWFLDDDLFDAQRYLNDQNDERRLFYVAVSRARDYLFITGAADVGLKKPVGPSVFYGEAAAFTPPDSAHEPARPPARRGALPLVTSHSSLEYYLTCPYRYLLLREYGLASPDNPFFSVGRALHLALRVAHEETRDGREMTVDAVTALFEKHLTGTDRIPPYVLNRRLLAVTRAIRDYLQDKAAWIKNTVDVERPFDVPAFGSVIRGRIDLIVREPDNTVTVVDWKTGHQREYLHPEFQMQLYAWAARDMLGLNVGRTVLYYVEEKRSIESTVSDEFITAGQSIVRSALEGIYGSQFTATPGPVCTRCECRPVCGFRMQVA